MDEQETAFNAVFAKWHAENFQEPPQTDSERPQTERRRWSAINVARYAWNAALEYADTVRGN